MPLRATQPVPFDRAAAYRAAGWWGARRLADGIEAAATSRPGAAALIAGDRCLTWHDLALGVGGAARRLAASGVHGGSAVALVTGNTIEGAVAYHALLRIGAAVAVLDRRCGTADLRAAVEALGDRWVLVAAGLERERLPAGMPAPEGVAALETVSGPVEGDPVPDGPEPDRSRPAVVLFTSGTTGRSKGVVHSLDTLTAGAANMARITGCTEVSVIFLVSPLTSITGIMQLHLAADCHAALVLEDRFDPASSLERIERHRATLLGGAPVIAERLLRAAEESGTPTISLRTLALGGAMLPMPLLELAARRFGIEVARVYGSSEAPNSTGSLPTDSAERRLHDDGAPMPGTEIRVGSSEHPGEALVRGPQVFLGYADPTDNETAFEDGWFRTGDAVEVQAGRLTVVGRIKDVVNRNGLKIAPAEIDAALAGLAGVVECSTFGLPDPDTGERLAVAVRPEAGARVSLDDVCAHLRAEGVAVRKLPEQLVVWDEPLPRTPSGKIVRAQLVMRSPAKHNELATRLRDP